MAVPQAGQNDPVWGRRSPHCEQNRRLEEPSAGTLDEVIASTSSYGQHVAADIDVTVTDRAPLGNGDASPERGQAWK